MTDTPVVSLDSQLAALLTDLSEVQRKLLALIGEKRTLLLAANVAGLASLQPREAAINRAAPRLPAASCDIAGRCGIAGLSTPFVGRAYQRSASTATTALDKRDSRRPSKGAAAATPKLNELGLCAAHFDPSFADVGDYRDRRPVTSDIWKRRYCRYQWKPGRSGSLDRWAKVCGRCEAYRASLSKTPPAQRRPRFNFPIVGWCF